MGDASLAGPVRGAASLAEACANEAGDAASMAARIVAPARRIALSFMAISWQRWDGRDGTVLGRLDDRAGTLGDQIRIGHFHALRGTTG